MIFKYKKDRWIYFKCYFIIMILYKSLLVLGIICVILFLGLLVVFKIGEI